MKLLSLNVPNSITKKANRIKEKIIPPCYDICSLETGINRETGEIRIYNVTSIKFEKSGIDYAKIKNKKGDCTTVNFKNRSIIHETIENIENNDVIEYSYMCIKGFSIYPRWFQGDSLKIAKGFDFNSLSKSLYSILGKTYGIGEKFTKKQLLELKEEMQKHIHDKQYYALYKIMTEDDSGRKVSQLAVAVSRKYPEMGEKRYRGRRNQRWLPTGSIEKEKVHLEEKRYKRRIKRWLPKRSIEEEIVDLDGNYIGTFYRSRKIPYNLFYEKYSSPKKTNPTVLTVENGICNLCYDKYSFTEFAIKKIVEGYEGYKASCLGLFRQATTDTEQAASFCPQVPTPIPTVPDNLTEPIDASSSCQKDKFLDEPGE